MIPDRGALRNTLQAAGLGAASDELAALTRRRLDAHGDADRWRSVLRSLPEAAGDPDRLRNALLELAPWRKGPFELGGIEVDAEWRSDLKWARVADAIGSLHGRRVLDVGCGNGYYAFRMREAGADVVIGLDPTVLYVMQFLAVQYFRADPGIAVLPLRLDELPAAPMAFDTTFSMGVLYHQRSPLEHLRQLRATLAPGGELVLETLYLPGDEAFARTPPGRYARMNNVWLLPTIAELVTWLERSRFDAVRVVDTSVTTSEEQRRTDWMPFESLADGLDPDDPSQTIEGWPAPRRVVVIAARPA